MPKDAAQLLGSRAETDVLDRLLEAVRTGNSRALVVRGEPGMGKTALLEYLAGRASGCRVATAAARAEIGGMLVGRRLGGCAVHGQGRGHFAGLLWFPCRADKTALGDLRAQQGNE